MSLAIARTTIVWCADVLLGVDDGRSRPWAGCLRISAISLVGQARPACANSRVRGTPNLADVRGSGGEAREEVDPIRA